MTDRRPARSVLAVLVCAAVAWLMVMPAADAAPDVTWVLCGDGTCDGEVTDDYTDRTDTATDLDDDLTQPTGATTAVLAATYEERGLPWCRFEGMRRDDEAGLATWDIDRGCPDVDSEDEDEDGPARPSFEEIVAYIASACMSLPIAPSPIT